MHELAILASILGVFLLGAMSPGPSFIVVSRIAIARSRADGLMAAVGMGIGGFFFACIAVAGLTAILLQVEWLNILLRLAGGAYLVWIGIGMLRSDGHLGEGRAGRLRTPWHDAWRGFVVIWSNPKALIFLGALLPQFVDRAHPALPQILLLGLTFMAIDDDQAKAVKTVEDYVMRYYGRLRADVANTSLVGSPAAIVDRIGEFLSRGLDTLIIGLADPDPRQLDRFGEKVLPKVK